MKITSPKLKFQPLQGEVEILPWELGPASGMLPVPRDWLVLADAQARDSTEIALN